MATAQKQETSAAQAAIPVFTFDTAPLPLRRIRVDYVNQGERGNYVGLFQTPFEAIFDAREKMPQYAHISASPLDGSAELEITGWQA